MTVSDNYDIDRILNDLDLTLQIDGTDHIEKDIDKVVINVKQRIARQYQVDLTNTKIDDPALFIDKFREASVLFVENVTQIHGRLCGYLHIARYTCSVIVRPSNVNYLGFDDVDFMTILSYCQRKATIPSVDDNIQRIKQKLCTINNCRERRMFLIMIVAYELGFYEIMAAIAEIIYLGGRV